MPEQSRVRKLSPEERLGKLLIRAEVVKKQQLDEALRIHRQHPEKPLGDILTDKGWCSEWAIAKAISTTLQKRLVSVKKALISQKVVQLVPEALAAKHNILPLFVQNKTLYLVMENPLISDVVREIRKHSKMQVVTMVAVASQLREAVRKHYNIGEYVGEMLDQVEEKAEVGVEQPPEASKKEKTSSDKPAEDKQQTQVVKLVNLIFSEGIKTRASDIHIEPSAQDVRVRYRIDGMLTRGIKLPQEVYAALISRIKMLAGMDIADHQNPQDGRFRVTYTQRNVDLRVSTLPTNLGEEVVIRILDSTSRFYDITRLGFSPEHSDMYQPLLQQSQGLILIAGPSGSGKTTTAYALLNAMKDGTKHLVTIEDPVEYQLEGVTQIQINPKSELMFASGLRSVLRQDPNVIFLGEIRDAETASVAIQASETGHLVLSTLNTTSSMTAVNRLFTLGIAPDVVASHLRGVIAQRLVRRVCPRCITTYTPTEQELQNIGIQGVQSEFDFHRGEGCKACRNTGYYGQVGIFEFFLPDQRLREAIEQRVSIYELQRLTIESGMKTLRESGLEKVFQGLTTIEEVVRVAPLEQEIAVQTRPASPAEKPTGTGVIPGQATPQPVAQQQPLVCGQCGTRLEKNWMICPVCGWIKTETPAGPSGTTPPTMPTTGGMAVSQEPAPSENLAPPEPPASKPMQVDVPRTKERIVLAEDDPNTRMMVKFFLQQQDYEVVLASDGEEALEKIRAERPDMVILDVNMPRKDGFAVCKEMRSHIDTMFTPIIMLTAQSSIEAKLQGLSLGADDYVTKPFHPAELAARIEVVLRRAYMHEVVSSG